MRTYGQNEDEAARIAEDVVNDADIAILDQRFEYNGEANILGRISLQSSLRNGLRGSFACAPRMVADEDVRSYKTAGAHCVFGKDILMKDMVK